MALHRHPFNPALVIVARSPKDVKRRLRPAVLAVRPAAPGTYGHAGFGYPAGPMHDENYKKIFAFPRVIEDLLRAFVPGDWLQEVDFATLGKLSTEYISDELLKRHGDNVWRMRLRKNWLYLQPITARRGAGG